MANNEVKAVLDRVCNLLSAGRDIDREMRVELTSALSTDSLQVAFIDESDTIGPESPAINIPSMEAAFARLDSHDICLKLVASIIQNQYQDLGATLCQSPEHLSSLRTVPILLACPAFSRPDKAWSRTIIVNMAKTLLHLEKECQPLFKSIGKWLGNDRHLMGQAVKVFHGGLQGLRRSKAYKEIGTLDSYIGVLELLSKINEDHQCTVPRQRFYIDGLESEPELYIHFLHFVLIKGETIEHGAPTSPIFTWLSAPCLLNVKTKWKLVSLEADIIQRGAVDTDRLKNLSAHGIGQSQALYFKVDIENIFKSAIENVDKYWPRHGRAPGDFWLKPLVVDFIGHQELHAYNRKRVLRDFFQRFFDALVDDSNLGFFRKIDRQNPSSTIWFDESNFDMPTLDKIGLLFGLLIYNGAVVTVRFPPILYEKLLTTNSPLVPEDLKQFDPELEKQLFKLREYSAEDLEALCLDFEGLQRDGEDVNVTKDNLEQYIDATIRAKLAPNQYGAFSHGFSRLFAEASLLRAIFKPEELRNVIDGEEFDWNVFEQSAIYEIPRDGEQPFDANHPVVRMFWKVFHDLEERDKRRFLKVLTGADHAPIEGFRSLNFLVRRMDVTDAKYRDPTDPDRHPQPADLCPEIPVCPGYHIMYLPDYQTEEDARFRLLMLLNMRQ